MESGAVEELVPLSGSVNTGVFVAPGVSWLIVYSTRRSGFGGGDLYFSDRWPARRNLLTRGSRSQDPIRGPSDSEECTLTDLRP